MEECIRALRKSLTDGRLLLIDDESEFLVIETRQQLNKLGAFSLQVGDYTIDASLNARNLGAGKACVYHIHNILSEHCGKT